jgi:glycosyltransferase involved in cell wall biosynthesis
MYNSEATIERCIKSVLSQTYYDCIKEIIVIDDGSTDMCSQIVQNIAIKEPRIILISKENGGVSSARNAGLKKVTGDYIALLDSDDEWLPQKIEKQISIFELFTDTAFVGTTYNGIVHKYFFFCKFGILREIKLKHQLLKNYFQPSTILMKKEVYDIVGYFNEKQRYAEEGNYFFRVCKIFKCILLNESLLIFGDGKMGFGQSGLSANLREMEKGELQNLKFALSQKYVSLFGYIFLIIFSILKYCLRVIIVKYKFR